MGLTRISAAALLCYAITICWQTVNSEFTTEDCKQLNNTVNVTCTNDEINYYTVNFQNDAQFKIYITVDNETETNSITITCQGGDEDILRINKNLTKFSLQHHDFASITVDGCIPFEDILKGFEIKLSTDFKLQRGITSTSLKPEHLRNLAALSNLVLSGFEKLDEQIFANMKSLEKLELTRFEAPLPGGVLSAIGDNLVQLNMRDNRMHQPPERLFTPLNRLELLDLSFNKLQTIPSGTFDQLENLIELDLSENRIELLPADVFQSLRALARLYLANNRLKRLDLGTFSTLNNLQQLGIENNALEIAPIEACKIFDGLSKLDYLELSNNSLTTYCLPHNMSSVQVSVSYNQIRELLVPTGAHQPRQLTKLNVRHNRLEHLSDEVLLYLHESLPELSLAHNPWQCDWASSMWLAYIKFNNERIRDLGELECTMDNTVRHVITINSSDIGKPASSIPYIIALAILGTLATLAVLAAFIYRRRATRKSNAAPLSNSVSYSNGQNGQYN